MNEWRKEDFCTAEQGLDYAFANMGAIYGTTFTRNFTGIDPRVVRSAWLTQCGHLLTYRPAIDHALRHMNADYPPSAIKFKGLLAAIVIPERPQPKIEVIKTPEEQAESKRLAEEARAALRALIGRKKML
jgi:hypothetical protein